MACTDGYFTCDTIKGKTPEDVLRLLIRTDSNGCAAIATKVVTGASVECTPHVDCGDQGLTWQDLVMILIGTDGNGCAALRTIVKV